MYRKHVTTGNNLLEDMVKVKKIRFQGVDEPINLPQVSRRAFQKRANFQEFKEVYADTLERKSGRSVRKEPCLVHKTKSGSLCRIPNVRKDPQFVDTITLELPLHYGGDRAVQLLENKIKPRKAIPKVHRSVVTDNIAKKLAKIEEEADVEDVRTKEATKTTRNDIQMQLKTRKETVFRNLPRVALQKPKRKVTKDKIMNELAHINEKLKKMQEKYLDKPKVQYKNVNNCCTQSGYANIALKMEDDMGKSMKNSDGSDQANATSANTLLPFDRDLEKDSKMGESLQEMNEMFPEFPKIEDTLKEIEAHLDNIVNLNSGSDVIRKDSSKASSGVTGTKFDNFWRNGGLESILSSMDREHSRGNDTDKILKGVEVAKGEKLRTIRKQIEEVEEFCDRMSEIANDDHDDLANALSDVDSGVSDKEESNQNDETASWKPQVMDFMEGPDLRNSIKKSTFLTREFGNLESCVDQPMVKVFSDNDQTILWRKKLRSLSEEGIVDLKNVESVTRMINNLKFTLEDSLYEPVA